LKRLVSSGPGAGVAAGFVGVVVFAGSEAAGNLGPGFGVKQQAHLSFMSALDTRHVSQVHLEVAGFENMFLATIGEVAVISDVGVAATVEKSKRLASILVGVCAAVEAAVVVEVVAVVSATMGLLQLAQTGAGFDGVTSTDNASSTLDFLGSLAVVASSVVSSGVFWLFGDVLIHRQFRQTIFKLSLEKLHCIQVHLLK